MSSGLTGELNDSLALAACVPRRARSPVDVLKAKRTIKIANSPVDRTHAGLSAVLLGDTCRSMLVVSTDFGEAITNIKAKLDLCMRKKVSH